MLRRELGKNIRGVSRWHFFGEHKSIKEEDSFEKYHPHLNILIEHGSIEEEKLQKIRLLWSNWLKELTNVKKEAVIHYSYVDSSKYKNFHKFLNKVFHKVKYISRATFLNLNEKNKDLAEKLYSFKNTSWFGIYSFKEREEAIKIFQSYLESFGRKKKKVFDIDIKAWENYKARVCPECGKKINFLDIARVGINKEGNVKEEYVFKDYGGGLFLAKLLIIETGFK
jgi:hypothetical protein